MRERPETGDGRTERGGDDDLIAKGRGHGAKSMENGEGRPEERQRDGKRNKNRFCRDARLCVLNALTLKGWHVNSPGQSDKGAAPWVKRHREPAVRGNWKAKAEVSFRTERR